MPFIYSSCLIALSKTSSTMLNKRGKAGIPVLFFILRETLVFLLVEYDVSGFVICGISCLGVFPLTHFAEFLL